MTAASKGGMFVAGLVLGLLLAGGLAATWHRHRVPPQTPTPPVDKRIRVLVCGDCMVGMSCPYLAALLPESYVVTQEAENTQTSTSILAHIQEYILGRQPDVLVLDCGVHDLTRLKPDQPPETAPELYDATLRQILKLVRRYSPHTRIVFIPIAPTIGDAWEANYPRKSISAYNALAEQACQDFHVAVFPLPDAVKAEKDGIHPTDSGYEALARGLRDWIVADQAAPAGK